MNFCLACREVRADGWGGLPRAIGDLAQSLAQAGHSVHLLTDVPIGEVPELRGVSLETVRVSTPPAPFAHAAAESAAHNLMYAAAAYREVKRIHEEEEAVDVVLAPLWRSEGAVCVLDDRFPTIVSCMTSLRTLTEIDGAYHLLPDIAERLSLEREALRRSRYLHGLTDAVLRKTVSDYDLHPEATAVIGRGLRDRAPARRPSSSRQALPRDPDDPAQARDPNDPAQAALRVLFVGRIERRKGVDTLLAAARELVSDRVPVTFTLAGADADPSFRDSFEQAVVGLPELGDAVRFTGAVSDRELDRLYAEADIVCVPSRYESHGVVLIEAMMFGKPIVTCDAGGIGEVVVAGSTALVSPPEDAAAIASSLRRLVADAGLRARLGAAAREAYEQRFEASTVARRLESFIEEVVALHGDGRESSNDRVRVGLERLLVDALALAPEAAFAVAGELLAPPDPVAQRTAQRLRRAALATPARRARSSQARVSAVVLTRNRPRSLGRALDSLALDQTPPHTVVIDNGSAPAAARRVAEECARRTNTELRRSERNLGCAGGRRLGAEMVTTELVLFLDDDAELLPGALDHLVAELDSHPSAGAVTATVVLPDGHVHHSGGSLACSDEIASFGLIGAGSEFAPDALPPSGPAGWVPGGALLVRRELLEEFPLDQRMAAYFEDNEWCYGISLARPGTFRRSREALVLHHFSPAAHDGASFSARSRRIELLAACARFYERHRLLLAPALFELMPELRAGDGAPDLAGARMLMELMLAKGSAWTLEAWMRGDLTGLLSAYRWKAELHATESALDRARLQFAQELESREELMTFLHRRHETLCRIEQGGWWRLRQRLLPAIRFAGWLHALRRGDPSGIRSGQRAPLGRPDPPSAV